MDNYRSVFLTIASNVFKIKSFGHYIINLNSTELPFSAKNIFNHKVDFRTIKSCFAQFNFILKIHFIGSFLNFLLCSFPKFNFTAVFFRVIISKRKLSCKIFKSECAEHNLNEFDNLFYFSFKLILTNE